MSVAHRKSYSTRRIEMLLMTTASFVLNNASTLWSSQCCMATELYVHHVTTVAKRVPLWRRCASPSRTSSLTGRQQQQQPRRPELMPRDSERQELHERCCHCCHISPSTDGRQTTTTTLNQTACWRLGRRLIQCRRPSSRHPARRCQSGYIGHR